VCWSSVATGEGEGAHHMHDALGAFQPSSQETSRTLRESGIESRAEQEAKARQLMMQSEQDDEDIQEEAERYRHDSRKQRRQAPDAPARSLGWSAEELSSRPSENPEAERIRLAMQQSVHATESDQHIDLGEGVAVNEATGSMSANAMTARAQLKAKQKAAEAARQQKVESAKRIAAKVRKLVAVQRHLEEESDVPHTGMVEMQESTEATRKIAEEAKLRMQDSLLTQKLQAENARKTFKHLMEEEREEQHRALEAERKRSHDVLEAVKKSLQERQQQMIKQMAATEQKVETKLEKTLARTKIAAAIEDVIKRKLSKRVEKLTRAGERVVDGVTGTVNSLKRRVRRLRRSQDRIRNEQSAIQRTVSAEKTAERQYLGESSETEHLRRELKTIRHQLEQRSQPASQQHTQSNMKLENELLKEKLRNAELQNQLVHSTQQPQAAKIEKYSTSTMRNYFNNRRQKEKLAQKVQDEEQNLKMMIVNLKETDNNPKRHDKLARQVQAEEQDLKAMIEDAKNVIGRPETQLQADVFLQMPEKLSEDGEVGSPTYKLHKEQADDDLKSLLALAETNKHWDYKL